MGETGTSQNAWREMPERLNRRRFANSTCPVCAHLGSRILLELARSDLHILTLFADEWPAVGQQFSAPKRGGN